MDYSDVLTGVYTPPKSTPTSTHPSKLPNKPPSTLPSTLQVHLQLITYKGQCKYTASTPLSTPQIPVSQGKSSGNIAL